MNDLPRTYREVMNSRTINDMKLKMSMIKDVSEDKLVEFFLSMCDFGLNNYINSEKSKFPEKSDIQIMREFYFDPKKNKKRL